MIPYGKQDISQQDIDSVIEVLKSDFLTQGPKVPAFEQTLKDYTGADYAIAVNSATSALHIACLALGLRQNDWLWTTPITFVASANCGLYCGAQVDFVDIDTRTYNMSVDALEAKLQVAEQEGCLPKIVIPVHLCGQSCDMKAIRKLADKYNFYIIEDASHAVGGKYRNSPIGNCEYSDVTIFSFHPVKIITTAEGGVALTNNANIAQKMALFRSHGITRDEALMSEPSHGDWYYQQVELGFNYRMTELQAALGISQMDRLNGFVRARHCLSARYNALLSGLPITLPYQHDDSYSSFHLYVIQLDLDKIKLSQKEIFKLLRESGIGVNLHYIPVHIQPYYKRLGFKYGDFPEAEKYYSKAISLPLFSKMTNQEQDTVVKVLRTLLLQGS
jgi:UDP-4-amino-4,6-dideoxy-N-acetyl-beta-L-altrosamine transaminase